MKKIPRTVAQGRSPGIAVKGSPLTLNSRSRRARRCTLRTRIHSGSDLRTRTGCCGSTSPNALTFHAGQTRTSKLSLSNSTTCHAEHLDGRLPQRYSSSRNNHSKRPVLQRPIESDQFTSWAFTNKIRSAGSMPSFGSMGDAHDNTVMDSFW